MSAAQFEVAVPPPRQVVAIDWSGRRTSPGPHLWIARARTSDAHIHLERGKSREQVIRRVAELVNAEPETLVGLDFAFSFPSDVDWDRGTIRIQRTLQRLPSGLSFGEPKSATSRRTIPLGKSMMATLRAHRRAQAEEQIRFRAVWQDGDLIFCTELGTPLDAGNVLRRHHYPLLKRAGLPRLRFHDLRHTAATLLLEAGAHPRVVAERLGHATPSLVMNTYGHATQRMQTEATAALEHVLSAS